MQDDSSNLANSPVMGIRVGVYHWRLKAARAARGFTLAHLSLLTGINSTTLGSYERLLCRPSRERRREIADALDVAEADLFPPELEALPAASLKAVHIPISGPDVARMVARHAIGDTAEQTANESWAKDVIPKALSILDPRARRIVEMRNGLDGGTPRTYAEIAEELSVTGSRIRQIDAESLRRLRHPSVSRSLSPDGPAMKGGVEPPVFEIIRRNSEYEPAETDTRITTPPWAQQVRGQLAVMGIRYVEQLRNTHPGVLEYVQLGRLGRAQVEAAIAGEPLPDTAPELPPTVHLANATDRGRCGYYGGVVTSDESEVTCRSCQRLGPEPEHIDPAPPPPPPSPPPPPPPSSAVKSLIHLPSVDGAVSALCGELPPYRYVESEHETMATCPHCLVISWDRFLRAEPGRQR